MHVTLSRSTNNFSLSGMVVEGLSSPPSCRSRCGCCGTGGAHHHGSGACHRRGGNEISHHEEEWGSLFCRCWGRCRWGGAGTLSGTGDPSPSGCSRNGTCAHNHHAILPAVGLADVATRPEGLEQLDHLEVAHGDVLSVLVLSQNVGGVDVINSGEDSIYTLIHNPSSPTLKELTVDQQNVLSINEHFLSIGKQGLELVDHPSRRVQSSR